MIFKRIKEQLNFMPFVKLDNGYNIHYLDKGAGKNLVYIHGFLGSSWIYECAVEPRDG